MASRPKASPGSSARAAERGRGTGTGLVALFSATLFLSAGLMFLVQPMFAKFVLPLFGSTPAVWNASMLFFQTTLLAGYLYAHESTRRLGVRRQAALHVGDPARAAARAADRRARRLDPARREQPGAVAARPAGGRGRAAVLRGLHDRAAAAALARRHRSSGGRAIPTSSTARATSAACSACSAIRWSWSRRCASPSRDACGRRATGCSSCWCSRARSWCGARRGTRRPPGRRHAEAAAAP